MGSDANNKAICSAILVAAINGLIIKSSQLFIQDINFGKESILQKIFLKVHRLVLKIIIKKDK